MALAAFFENCYTDPDISTGKPRSFWKVHLWKQTFSFILGCALTFASEAKFEIEAKISFRLEAKKKPDFT